MAPGIQPGEKLAGLLELVGPGALGEVAGNDDEVGGKRIDARFDRFDQPLVMC